MQVNVKAHYNSSTIEHNEMHFTFGNYGEIDVSTNLVTTSLIFIE